MNTKTISVFTLLVYTFLLLSISGTAQEPFIQCDGVYDLPSCMDEAAANGGGTIVLQEQTYLLTTSLILQDNVNIVGQSYSSVITWDDSVKDSIDEALLYSTRVNNISLQNFKLRCHIDQDPASSDLRNDHMGIFINGGGDPSVGEAADNNNIYMESIEAVYCSNGMHIKGVQGITGIDLKLHSNGNTEIDLFHNIYLRRAADIVMIQTTETGAGYYDSPRGHGFRGSHMANIYFENLSIYNNADHGVHFTDGIYNARFHQVDARDNCVNPSGACNATIKCYGDPCEIDTDAPQESHLFPQAIVLPTNEATPTPVPTLDYTTIQTNDGWGDSYEVNGSCYCDSTFDHGAGDIVYEGVNVRTICEALGDGAEEGRVYYNTLQCGHQPGHFDSITINGQEVQDEQVCPGIVGNGITCNQETGPLWNLDLLTSQSAYQTHTVPGVIEAEHFDNGVSGIAYNDTTNGDNGDTGYRPTDVDLIALTTDNYKVGWVENGEWLEYTADVDAGTYRVDFLLSSNSDPVNGQLNLTIDGIDYGAADAPYTGDWNTFEVASINDVEISTAGVYVIRLDVIGGDFDMDSMTFVSIDQNTVTETPIPVATSTPSAAPLHVTTADMHTQERSLIPVVFVIILLTTFCIRLTYP